MPIAINGTTLNVWDTGDSNSSAHPALVFLHFYDGSSRTWTEVIHELAPDFRCIAPDLRGFGDSAAPASGYRVEDNADDIIALIKTLNLTRFILIGHSMGGKIALATAARLQSETSAGKLTGLVLIAPSPPTPEPMNREEGEHLRQAWGNYEESVATVYKISRLPVPIHLVERTAQDMLRASRVAHDAWIDIGSKENIAEQVTGIAVPVLVVAGECDPVMDQAMLCREVVERLPHARMVLVPGAGHLLPLEATSAVVRHIREAI